MQLRRRTTTGEYIAEIDGLRFLCITPVVVWHLATTMAADNPTWRSTSLYRFLSRGALGVVLFFIISGFILVLPHARAYRDGAPRAGLRRYYLRRLTRLEPPYLLAMPIGAAATIAGGSIALATAVPHVLVGMVYGHWLVYGQENPANGLTWSLEVEIQFYLLLPLLAGVFAIGRARWRRAAMAGAALLAAVISTRWPTGRMTLSVVTFIPYFAAGFLLADLYVNEWAEAPRTDGWWNPIATIAAVAFPLSTYHSRTLLGHVPGVGPGLDYLVPAVAAGVLFVSAFRAPVFRRLLRTSWLTLVGGMCYSIYLLHQVAISAWWRPARRVLGTGSLSTLLAVWIVPVVALVLFVSGAFFVLVERPCMDPSWPQRLRARVRGAQPASRW